MIDDSVFDTVHSALPQESPLSGPLRTASNNPTSANPTSSHSNGPTSPPPTQGLQNLSVQSSHSRSQSPAPPLYEDTPPPGPPPRDAAASAKPVVAHARALYRYSGSDARDLGLEKDDKVEVHEYMNQDWWMGRNLRTGQDGIFPRNYVFVEQETKSPFPQQPMYAQPQQQPLYGYPGQSQGPPAQQSPYNSSVPPMAMAEGGQPVQGQGQGHGKAGVYGKKFGKKLGNAAIFGAGASIGGNIVNSIF